MNRPLALLLMAAILLPGMTVGLVAWRTHDAAIAKAADDRRQQARALREHALRVFEAQALTIALVDAELGDEPLETAAANPRLQTLMHRIVTQSPHIEGIWLVDASGHMVRGIGGRVAEEDDITGTSLFQATKQDTDFHLGAVDRPGDTGWALGIARRRGAENGGTTFDGAILVTVQRRYFEQIWQETGVPEGRIVSMINAQGEFLARFPSISGTPPRLPADSGFFAQRIQHPEEGEYRYNSIFDNVDRFYSYIRLPDLDSYIVVGLDGASVTATWRRETEWQALIALLVSAVLSAAVLQAWRRGRALARANVRLLSTTGALEAEIARRRAVESTLMAREEHDAALRAANAALRAEEERFRLLFTTMTQGVVIHGPDGAILSANAAAEQILGRNLDEMRRARADDREWAAVDVDGHRLEAHEHPAIRALATGKVVQATLMGVFNPRRLERRWIVVDAVPMLRDGDTVPSGAYAVFSDVTDRRRGEQAQRLLIREVDHRAKNALAVVQAVIRLTKAETPERFVEVVEGRVAALAHAHTILAMNRWEGASLTRLVQVELEAYADPDSDARVRLEGPDIVVLPEAAQPLSMVLHELTTNAAKHGALSRPEGRLLVRWSVIANGDWIRLDWQETGAPVGEAPIRQGFGSTMIEASMRQQLQGTITYDWTPQGLHAVINFPADQLVTQEDTSPVPAPDTADKGDGPRGPRVLVVEDSIPLGQLFREMLEVLDYRVIGPANTMSAALAAAQVEALDAAMLDIGMRDAEVFPVAEILRERGVPLLFCTGYTNVTDWGSQWSDVPVLRKPVTLPALRVALARLLEQPHLHAEP
ncbi:HWE histidine kinase domain-containing protein [Niveispirillum irakense]|uniref:HWE histidine kinase domain-containing protein n=1 Tax=Niveispirillum irakense TaxID=34011 RepID=UPI000683EE05|nr:HWE histidine kinase domain-containing protein [Niveispirillum irakense]